MDESKFDFIFTYVISMIIQFYANTSLPRDIVDNIIISFKQLISIYIFPCMKNDIVDAIKSEKDESRLLKKIMKIFAEYEGIFEKVDTETKRFSELENYGFVYPSQYCIGAELQEKNTDSGPRILQVLKYGVSTSLRKTFKLFFRVPEILRETLRYIDQLDEDSPFITNIIQTKFWKQNYLAKHNLKVDEGTRSKQSIILPLYVYFDEVEPGHSLGSHAGTNKIGAVYASLACLPPFLASLLHSIILSTVVYAKDMTTCKVEGVFKNLIEDLNSLALKGIKIGIENIDTIYLQCVIFIGDNLGLNSMFGWSKSFISDNCCRFCKATYKDIQTLVEEDEKLLRTKKDYEASLLESDLSENAIPKSAFNKIEGFQVLENIGVDSMHDILEGIGIYDLKSL